MRPARTNESDGKVPKRSRPRLLISASDTLSQAKVTKPTAAVKHNFCWRCSRWISIDVETHDLAPRTERHWEDGRFGHLRRVVKLEHIRALRIVQVGLTFGDFDSGEAPVTKTYLVKPEGFVISPSATKCHGITQAAALELGMEISEALRSMFADLKSVLDNGGRVCNHNLEFDAEIISCEMERAGMHEDDVAAFELAVHCGMCTMNPVLTKWCCEEFLRATSRYSEVGTNDVPVAMEELKRVLDVPTQASLQPAHDAGVDSRAVWLVLRELRRMVLEDTA